MDINQILHLMQGRWNRGQEGNSPTNPVPLEDFVLTPSPQIFRSSVMQGCRKLKKWGGGGGPVVKGWAESAPPHG